MAYRIQKEEEDGTTVRLSVTVPRRLHDELERTAQENDASIAWVVRKAVASYFQGGLEHHRRPEGRRQG